MWRLAPHPLCRHLLCPHPAPPWRSGGDQAHCLSGKRESDCSNSERKPGKQAISINIVHFVKQTLQTVQFSAEEKKAFDAFMLWGMNISLNEHGFATVTGTVQRFVSLYLQAPMCLSYIYI